MDDVVLVYPQCYGCRDITPGECNISLSAYDGLGGGINIPFTDEWDKPEKLR